MPTLRNATLPLAGTARSTMRAIVSDSYGTADVLRLETVDRPTPKDGEVLLRVQRASVNPGDWHVMRGIPYLIRVLGYGLRRPKQRIPGQDVAGVVEAVGEGVTDFKPGDEVFGYGKGTFAEFAAAPADQLRPKPAHLSLEEASTLPVAGLTALHALRDQAKLQPGQKILIIGAGGGIGTFAVPMAKAYGAEVTGVCSTRNLERVRANGAEQVIDYTARPRWLEEAAANGPRYDVIMRISGDATVGRCRRALKPRGTLVVIGSTHIGRVLGGMEKFMGTLLLNLFTRQRLRPFISICNGEDLDALSMLLQEHDIKPVIDRSRPLEELPEAMRYIGEGHAQGKVVITM